jgi:hypothetical protein
LGRKPGEQGQRRRNSVLHRFSPPKMFLNR